MFSTEEIEGAGDVNTDLMEKLGLAEGIFAGRVALITGSARGI